VLEAASGAEALAAARGATRVDLLLTDVVMPGMDGTELARRLRAERPDIPVVYMSGYTGDDLERRATLEAGAPFLQKPVSPDALVRGVRDALDAMRGAES
jgi:two-component system cell cycle sensor histidine kinase/response regulator CckA